MKVFFKNLGLLFIFFGTIPFILLVVAGGSLDKLEWTPFFRQSFDDSFVDFFHIITPLTARQTRQAAS